MQVDHSIRACKLCRQRRIKCDKSLPTCKRCETSGRTCPGYPRQRVFVDQTMRYGPGSHISPYQNDLISAPAMQETVFPVATSTPQPEYGSSTSSVVGLQDFHTPASSGLANHVLPMDYQSPLAQDTRSLPLQQSTPTMDGFSDQDWEFFDLDIDTYYADGTNACGFFTDVGEVNTAVLPNSPASMAVDHWSSAPMFTQVDSMTIPKEELAPLMRLFVELLAPWMDLFDIDAYFSRTLPHQASLDVLLQFALAAVAAKQAARYLVTQRMATSTGKLDQIMASYSETRPKEWFFRAARYYDQGISSLRTILSRLPVGTMSAIAREGIPLEYTPDSSIVQNVLSAISIFSFYESLDDCFTTTSRHLVGFLALLNTKSNTSPAASNDEAQLILASKSAGRAAFWYFARKEMFAAYINHARPAVNPDNGLPWIEAGLPESIFSSLNTGSIIFQGPVDISWESFDHVTMVHALIWLATKVIKFIACNDGLSTTQQDGDDPNLSRVYTAQIGSEVWSTLRDQLRQWYDSRPQALRAYAVSEFGSPRNGRTINRTMSFTSSMAAAAIQIYHFAQILLLLNTPKYPPSLPSHATRLHALKRNADEVELHSREICAIAFCVPASNIQRQMSHPLQLAGVCFDNEEDRKEIIRILENAAAETCSAPEDMLQNLLMQWGMVDGESEL